MSFKLNGKKYRITLNVALVATVHKEGEGEVFERILGSDAAVCHSSDAFNPKVGAKLAVTRALQRAFTDPDDRSAIWSQIKGRVEAKGEKVFDDAVLEAGLGF